MSEIRVDSSRHPVVVVTIDRPARRNALNGEAWRDLGTAFANLGQDPTVRLVILAGAEGHFSAGDDLKDSPLKHGGVAAEEYLRDVQACYAAVETAPVPTIAAVSGACLGAGVSLALRCDFRVASRSAFFGVPAAKLGDFYPLEHCRRLVALMGTGRTRHFLYSGEPIAADDARHAGLVDHLVEGDPLSGAIAYGGSLVGKAPLTLASLKLAINAVVADEVDLRARDLDSLIQRILRSEDRQEGLLAFSEKRPPAFSGR